jgi:hypothetical protein
MTDYEDALLKIECLKAAKSIGNGGSKEVINIATDFYKFINKSIPIPEEQSHEFSPEQSVQ